MLELEKFGLVEMSSVEVKEVDGGFWGAAARYVGSALLGALACQDFGNLSNAYDAGYNAGNK